jgi:hypothetical protein
MAYLPESVSHEQGGSDRAGLFAADRLPQAGAYQGADNGRRRIGVFGKLCYLLVILQPEVAG